MSFTDLTSVPADDAAPVTAQLRLAVAAYLARFTGPSRQHTESDLRCYLSWCAGRSLDPLAARRPHLELYIRWMQETRHFKPSTVSRRFSVTAGFYRTCVIDGLLEHSPAEHVRRPAVPRNHPPWGSPTCSSRPCSPRLADLRSHRCRHHRPQRRARPPGAARVRQGHQGSPDPAAASRRAGHRPLDRRPDRWANSAQQPRYPDGPSCRHPAPALHSRYCGCPDRQGTSAESARGAVPVLPPARFPGPLAEPAVPVSRQRALRGCCHQAGFAGGHGVGILFPR